jgi:glycine/D-amino acid oxidase-like deaminating enzyme
MTRWRRASIPSRPTTPLPSRASVVIVGGGIIGASTALFLARKGVPTVLCEKGHIAGEPSSRNWGRCRKMARDPREFPLIIRKPEAVAGHERDDGGRDRLPAIRFTDGFNPLPFVGTT